MTDLLHCHTSVRKKKLSGTLIWINWHYVINIYLFNYIILLLLFLYDFSQGCAVVWSAGPRVWWQRDSMLHSTCLLAVGTVSQLRWCGNLRWLDLSRFWSSLYAVRNKNDVLNLARCLRSCRVLFNFWVNYVTSDSVTKLLYVITTVNL